MLLPEKKIGGWITFLGIVMILSLPIHIIPDIMKDYSKPTIIGRETSTGEIIRREVVGSERTRIILRRSGKNLLVQIPFIVLPAVMTIWIGRGLQKFGSSTNAAISGKLLLILALFAATTSIFGGGYESFIILPIFLAIEIYYVIRVGRLKRGHKVNY